MAKRKPVTAAAIATWAEGQAKPPAAHTPAYRRLTNEDRILILRYREQGLTQPEIAQRLSIDQSTVCRWLQACQDSTKEATAFLRGSALKMARKVVASDDGKVLIQALKGVSVLQEQQQQGVTVIVGAGSDGKIGILSPPASPVVVTEQGESS